MKFVSVRELRNTPGKIWEHIESSEVVLTINGKPIGVIFGTGNMDLDSVLSLVRRVRAQQAVSNMRSRAAANGANRLSAKAIDEEIAAARAERI